MKVKNKRGNLTLLLFKLKKKKQGEDVEVLTVGLVRPSIFKRRRELLLLFFLLLLFLLFLLLLWHGHHQILVGKIGCLKIFRSI
ncbi:MAG: hypothetical protein QXP16_06135 [Candidatus Bathyarchaeia archaeon]